jgi:hypothetical protein
VTFAVDEFIPGWLEGPLKKLDPADRQQFLAEYEAAVRDGLQRLEKVPVNLHRDGTEEGHFSLRLGSSDYFLNVKKAVWTAAKYAGPLIFVAAVSPALLAYLGITAATMPHVTAGATGSAGLALYGAFSKLDPAELDTYTAVAAAIERNKNRVLANSGASVGDVKESFQKDSSLFPVTDPHPVLEQLVSKLVLEKKVLGGVEQYFLAF